jgi:hypothetical protein
MGLYFRDRSGCSALVALGVVAFGVVAFGVVAFGALLLGGRGALAVLYWRFAVEGVASGGASIRW